MRRLVRRAVRRPVRRRCLVVLAAAAGCGGRADATNLPAPGAVAVRPVGVDSTPRGAYPVEWAPALRLASLAAVRQRLAEPTPDPIGPARFDVRCGTGGAAGARGGSTSPCHDVDTLVARSCDETLRAWKDGYGAVANMNTQVIDYVANTCTAIAAVGDARPARRSAVRAFRLTPAAVDSLPPVLGLIVSRTDSARAWADARRGVPWSRSTRGLKATVTPDSLVAAVLQVDSRFATTRVSVLARGDFDGDGWDDLLVRSIGAARGGTLVATSLFVLTRTAPNGQLRVVRQLW